MHKEDSYYHKVAMIITQARTYSVAQLLDLQFVHNGLWYIITSEEVTEARQFRKFLRDDC